MPRASATYENAAANNSVMAVGATVYISLHSADPGTTGASEFSGGGYVRQPYTVSAASGGVVSNTNAIAIPNAGTTPAPFYGLWSLSTAGVYYIGGIISPAITAATITAAAGGAPVAVA